MEGAGDGYPGPPATRASAVQRAQLARVGCGRGKV